MNVNSYAGPKQDAPCAAPITIGPGFLQNASKLPAAFSAWSMWQIEFEKPSGPRPWTSSNASSGPVAMIKWSYWSVDPSAVSIVLSFGETLVTGLGLKPMPRLAKVGERSTSTALRVLQPTGIHGLEGTK